MSKSTEKDKEVKEKAGRDSMNKGSDKQIKESDKQEKEAFEPKEKPSPKPSGSQFFNIKGE